MERTVTLTKTQVEEVFLRWNNLENLKAPPENQSEADHIDQALTFMDIADALG